MMRLRREGLAGVFIGGLLFAFLPLEAAQARPMPLTQVFVNGSPMPVHFNDGDSFRIKGGKLAGTQCRLGGYNTLETFGPCHRWGKWHKKEMYWLAKMATYHARRGVWHCESKDMKKDGYGRLLLYCKDLATDLVRRGLAHAYSVNYKRARPELLAAQRDAIKHRRGIWAHGVPDYIITSLHSAAEGGGRDGKTYNRMISAWDGHSAKWQHKDSYSTCQEVCRKVRTVSHEIIAKAVKELEKNAQVAAIFKAFGEQKALQVVGDYARLGYFGGVKNAEHVKLLEEQLALLQGAGKLGDNAKVLSSCMVYVPYKQHYGKGKASCLKLK
jgi:endonuclease YncB( thermonuclease family)